MREQSHIGGCISMTDPAHHRAFRHRQAPEVFMLGSSSRRHHLNLQVTIPALFCSSATPPHGFTCDDNNTIRAEEHEVDGVAPGRKP